VSFVVYILTIWKNRSYTRWENESKYLFIRIEFDISEHVPVLNHHEPSRVQHDRSANWIERATFELRCRNTCCIDDSSRHCSLTSQPSCKKACSEKPEDEQKYSSVTLFRAAFCLKKTFLGHYFFIVRKYLLCALWRLACEWVEV
jgi:hypothetical protein